MAKIVDQGWRITGAIKCIALEIEYAMGGHTSRVYIGGAVHIETRFGNSYNGVLKDYIEAEKEGDQDSLIIWNTGREFKVGIHDITYMEVADNGWVD